VGAAVFLGTLFLLASVAAAHSDLGFVLTGPETQARAGDAVHFSVTNPQKLVSYELEVGDTEVLGGSAVSGQFTMPNLGEASRTVTVEAELRGPGKKKTTVKRKLLYLGPALEAGGPPVAQPVDLPVVPQQPVSAPVPIHTPAAAGIPAPAALAPAAKPRSAGAPKRHARKRHSVKRQRHTSKSRRATHRKRHRRDKASRTRAKGPAPRTAPLFDGVPEPGSPRHPQGNQGNQGNDAPGLKAIAPPTAALTATGGAGSGESNLAILVPGLLGLAAFALAGVTLVRRQRSR
jgi:hypothetical protein